MAVYLFPKLPGNLVGVSLPEESPLGFISIPEYAPQACILTAAVLDQATLYSWDLTLGGVPYIYLFGWGPTTIQTSFLTFSYLNCERIQGLGGALRASVNLDWEIRESPFVTINIDGIVLKGVMVRSTARTIQIPGVAELTLQFLR